MRGTYTRATRLYQQHLAEKRPSTWCGCAGRSSAGAQTAQGHVALARQWALSVWEAWHAHTDWARRELDRA